MRIPPEHILERLVRNKDPRRKRSVGRVMIELTEDAVDQSGNVREQSPVMAEERAEVGVATFRIGSTDTRDALEIVATG